MKYGTTDVQETNISGKKRGNVVNYLKRISEQAEINEAERQKSSKNSCAFAKRSEFEPQVCCAHKI